MSIYVLRLINGEDVLGEIVDENQFHYKIKNPVSIAVIRGKDGGPNVGFAPFPLHAEQKQNQIIDIRSSCVIYSYVPAQDFVDNYNQVFGAGIVLPKKPQIITG